MTVPPGTGTSLTTFPEAVVIGLASGTTSSLTDFFNMLNATGWYRRISYSRKPRVSSLAQGGLEVGSTNLDIRVQVSHCIVVCAADIGVSPGTSGSTRSPDFIPELLLEIWVLGEFEEGKGQCMRGGFICGNRLVRECDAG